ncbi:MAG: nucleotide pyrophosphohydrolase [Bacteroidota bacterium]
MHSDLHHLTQLVTAFRDARDWSQFHNTKDLAVAISIEAAELNELFLWKSVEQCETMPKERIKEELADVFIYSLLLAHKHNFDIKEIITEKMKAAELKYPVEKAKGNSKKYTEL